MVCFESCFVYIFKYCSHFDCKYFAMTRKNHNIDDICEICRITNGIGFQYLPSCLRNDPQIIHKAIESCNNNITLLRFVSYSTGLNYWQNMCNMAISYDLFIKIISYITHQKELLPPKYTFLLNEHNVARLSVQINGCRIKQLNKAQRSNIELVKIACMQNGNALMYVNDDMKNNFDVVIPCVSKFPWALEYCSLRCRSSTKVISVATKSVKWVKRYSLQTA